ncbi:class I SAM-dependent methyltransferase [Desulfohalovibrio reitneri]|uniref:class I SAM-dependent methyltransferase n=1 Tax=Desulfohalovibrio reitneri TaxID=1307759 RepID=UPI00069065F8|nr:class I SAM-dependent methyltransferase [Desulfohalovibrio reitneri]
MLSKTVRSVLVCPHCRRHPEWATDELPHYHCPECDLDFPRTERKQLDFRPRHTETISLDFTLGEPFEHPDGVRYEPLEPNPRPDVDWSSMNVPKHFTSEILSYIPKAGTDAVCLDLGCGKGGHRPVAEHAGYAWLGLDSESKRAPVLGDAHLLPVADRSVDLVLSMAVLEHLRYPHRAMKEIHRVLKPGGLFIATVAFLEPFHSDSYFHMTHMGVAGLLGYAGFDVERLGPSSNCLHSIFRMGMFPGMSRQGCRRLADPVIWLHKQWWKRTARKRPELTERQRILINSGDMTMVARRRHPKVDQALDRVRQKQ